jgi:hypothetical protein
MLCKRSNTDYINLIKESISAAEYVVRGIIKAFTLGNRLKELGKKGVIVSQTFIP